MSKIVQKKGSIRRHIISGLLIWVPLAATFITFRFVINLFDSLLLYLPPRWQPEEWLKYDVPGIGLVLSIILIYITGVIASNYFGNRIVGFWENLLNKIPFFSTLYKGIKQMTEAIFTAGDGSFSKVYMIEYPKDGLWTLAFETSRKKGEAQKKVGGEDIVNLFVPTTPNPTSGYFIMINLDKAVELDMSVDEALKMIVSGGVYVPDSSMNKNKKNKSTEDEK